MQTSDDIQEDFQKWLPILWLPILISLFGVVFSFYSFHRTLPLSQSNIVFSESDILITNNFQTILPNIGLTKGDEIRFKVQNTGKSRADNVTFQIYFLPSNKNVGIKNTQGRIVSMTRVFSDSIIHSLPPDSEASIGSFIIPYIAEKDDETKIDLTDIGESTASVLVFCVAYTDSLNKQDKNSVYFFHYTIGSKNLVVLTVNDFYDSENKIKDRFFSQIGNETDTICPINKI